MRFDLKIQRLIKKYGLEGYGLYNLILEAVTENLSSDSSNPDLEYTCEDIADLFNGNTSHINEMMSFMINQDLFDLDELSGHVTCRKLYKFLDTSQTKSVKLRDMIKEFKIGQKALVTESHGKSETFSEISEEEKRKEEEENKKRIEVDKKIITKHKYGEYKHVLLTDEQYNKLIDELGEQKRNEMIKRLDEYIEMKGVKYKNHYLTILNWMKRDNTSKKKTPFDMGGINFEIEESK